MSVTALFEEQSVVSRPAQGTDWARGKVVQRPVMPTIRSGLRSADTHIEHSVESSLKSIERVIENYGAMNENVQYFRNLAEKHEKALQCEKDITRELMARLDEAQKESANFQTLLRAEKQRASEVNSRLVVLDDCVKTLEEENSILRAQAMRLVQGIEMLMAAENGLTLT